MIQIVKNFTFIFSILIALSSCKNEAKERYLSALDKTLDREIDWLINEIDNMHINDNYLFEFNGRPPRMKDLINDSDSLYFLFKKVRYRYKVEIKNESDIFNILKNKNELINYTRETYHNLKEIGDILQEIRGFKFAYYKDYEIITVPEKFYVANGDSFKAKIFAVDKPENAPHFAYKAYVDGNQISTDKNGVAEFKLSGDSTEKMVPGEYILNSKVWVDFGINDSVFTLQSKYKILPSRCD